MKLNGAIDSDARTHVSRDGFLYTNIFQTNKLFKHNSESNL